MTGCRRGSYVIMLISLRRCCSSCAHAFWTRAGLGYRSAHQRRRRARSPRCFGSACFTAYFGLQVTRELLKHFNRNLISEKGPSALGVTQRALERAPSARTLPALPAGKHWGPPSQIRNQVGCPSQSPAFGPFGDHRSASRTVNHCPTPVVAPRYVQHFVRTLNG